MLLLLFEVGSNRYGLEAPEVIEVTPLVCLRPAPHSPAYVAGVFNFRGGVTPVIDLHVLLGERPVRPLLSTRVMIVRLQGPNGEERRLGLMSERVTETISCRAEDFQPPGVHSPDAAYLGDLLASPGGLIQKVTVSQILPDKVKRLLFDQIDDLAQASEATPPGSAGFSSAPDAEGVLPDQTGESRNGAQAPLRGGAQDARAPSAAAKTRKPRAGKRK